MKLDVSKFSHVCVQTGECYAMLCKPAPNTGYSTMIPALFEDGETRTVSRTQLKPRNKVNREKMLERRLDEESAIPQILEFCKEEKTKRQVMNKFLGRGIGTSEMLKILSKACKEHGLKRSGSGAKTSFKYKGKDNGSESRDSIKA